MVSLWAFFLVSQTLFGESHQNGATGNGHPSTVPPPHALASSNGNGASPTNGTNGANSGGAEPGDSIECGQTIAGLNDHSSRLPSELVTSLPNSARKTFYADTNIILEGESFFDWLKSRNGDVRITWSVLNEVDHAKSGQKAITKNAQRFFRTLFKILSEKPNADGSYNIPDSQSTVRIIFELEDLEQSIHPDDRILMSIIRAIQSPSHTGSTLDQSLRRTSEAEGRNISAFPSDSFQHAALNTKVASHDWGFLVKALALGLQVDTDLLKRAAEESKADPSQEEIERILASKGWDAPLRVIVTPNQFQQIAHVSRLEFEHLESFGIHLSEVPKPNQFLVLGTETDFKRDEEVRSGNANAFDLKRDLLRVWRWSRHKINQSNGLPVKEHLAFRRLPDAFASELVVFPRSVRQIMYIDLLLDPTINLVTAQGLAGSGKTLLAVSIGMTRLIDGTTPLLRLTRPNQEAEEGYGFRPGTTEEKMEPLLLPFNDALSEWLRNYKLKTPPRNTGSFGTPVIPENTDPRFYERRQRSSNGGGRGGRSRRSEKREGRPQVNSRFSSEGDTLQDILARTYSPTRRILRELESTEVVQFEPLSLARGRNFTDWTLCDEAQNLKPETAQLLVSRIKGNSQGKLVLAGDTDQSDIGGINGLSWLVGALGAQWFAGHVVLDVGERSELATAVARLKLPEKSRRQPK